jgi:hypothetical protein
LPSTNVDSHFDGRLCGPQQPQLYCKFFVIPNKWTSHKLCF